MKGRTTMNKTILGIDPGMANTGLGVVTFEKHSYTLKKAELVKSTPKQNESLRLLKIYEAIYEILDELDIDAVAIEKVFHNKNVSSSIKTGKAIGAALTAAAQHDIPVIELTPQQVKSASGLSNKETNKDNLIRAASGIFKTDIESHHEADACLCALAGILQHRIPQLGGREPQEHRTRLRYNRESPDSIAERQPRRVRTP